MSDDDRERSNLDLLMFGLRASRLDRNIFPPADAQDLSRGARYIPGAVTVARREGKRVAFVQQCANQCCWYWQFPNGDRIYHWNRGDFHCIAIANKRWDGSGGEFSGDAGPCPDCGNTFTRGQSVKK